MALSVIMFVTNQQTNAASNVPVDVEKMIVKSLPAGMNLVSREVNPNGVFLHYANDAEPVNFKELKIEILKPGSQKKSLKNPGQGSWLPPAEAKMVHINNIPAQLKVQNGDQPWLELSADLGNKTINVFSRNFSEQELITALTSVDVSNVPLKDDKVTISEMNEIKAMIQNAKDLNDAKPLLKQFESKGWTLKEQMLPGYPQNELIAIGADAKDKTITFRIGNGQ